MSDKPFFSPEEKTILRQTVCKGLNDAQLNYFGKVCEKTGLDPFTRQIYAIPRGGNLTIQTGIDGFRATAERSGCYAGNSDAKFAESTSGIKAATVTVHKMIQGQKCDFTATARWDEYAPKGGNPMWKKMPHTMLAKCAEALALRKAFPNQLSGLYTTEEMMQADSKPNPGIVRPNSDPKKSDKRVNDEPEQVGDAVNEAMAGIKVDKNPKPLPEKLRRKLFAVSKGTKWTHPIIRKYIALRGVMSTKDLTEDQANNLIETIKSGADPERLIALHKKEVERTAGANA